MYLLMIISVERYDFLAFQFDWYLIEIYLRLMIINKPMLNHAFSFKVLIISISIAACLSFFWSIVPFLGWSHYTVEGAQIGCSVEWNIRTFNVVSYNIAITIFVFLLPLIAHTATCIKSIIIVGLNLVL